MGSYKCLVGPYLDGDSPYLSSPLGSVVFSLLCGVGMASNWTEVTVVPSVLARSVRRACSSGAGVFGWTQSLPSLPRGQDGKRS